MAERPPLRFLTDNCVPDSVAHTLRDAGYEVILLREILAPDSPDQVVAVAAEAYNAVLITFDKDLKALAPRIGIGKRQFRKLSRIIFGCREPNAAKRIKAALSLIEHEWEVAQSSRDERIIIHIAETLISTTR